MLLLLYMLNDCIHLRRINERALDTCDLAIAGIEHVSAADKLVSTLGVKHGTRVDNRLCAQRDTCRDICLDNTRHNVYRRTLSSQNHVHTYGTRFLRDTRNRRLHLLACLHDKVTVLVNDNHDVWQVLVMQRTIHQFVGIKAAVDELLVIILQVAHAGIHQQLVAVLHLNNQTVQRVNHLVAIGDNHLVLIHIGHSCQIVFEQRFVRRELYHLRVNEYHFQLCRMFLVEQTRNDSVDSH